MSGFFTLVLRKYHMLRTCNNAVSEFFTAINLTGAISYARAYCIYVQYCTNTQLTVGIACDRENHLT